MCTQPHKCVNLFSLIHQYVYIVTRVSDYSPGKCDKEGEFIIYFSVNDSDL